MPGRAANQLRVDHHSRAQRLPRTQPRDQLLGILPDEVGKRRRARQPHGVEASERTLTLVIAPTVQARADDRQCTGPPQLSRGRGRPEELIPAPVEERNTPHQIETREFTARTLAHVHEVAFETARRRARDASERRALHDLAPHRQTRAAESPGINRHGLECDLQTDSRHALRHQRARGVVLRRAGDPEPEIARADRSQIPDDLERERRVDRGLDIRQARLPNALLSARVAAGNAHAATLAADSVRICAVCLLLRSVETSAETRGRHRGREAARQPPDWAASGRRAPA